MPWADFAFNPTDGLKNTVSFPTDPADETAARKQFQDVLDQITTFFNGTVKTEIAAAANSEDEELMRIMEV